MTQKISRLIASILVCQTAGIIGSFFTVNSIKSWYAGINKPVFNPSNWIFGPVWITLFTLMGISLFLIWMEGVEKESVKTAIFVFLAHLVLNSLWSILFFGLHSPLAGFIEIVILWIAILITMFLFWKISKIAAILMVPYILWVSFAAVLNFAIWRLN